MKEVTLEMTQEQINRYHVINNSLEGKITVQEAAAALKLSERQITRLRNGVKDEGAAFLIHGNKGRVSSRSVTEEEKKAITKHYRSGNYTGSNFMHFSELLAEYEDMQWSYATVRRALNEAGIESPKKRRPAKTHRRRKRKAQEGLLTQLDATPFEWFGGKAKYNLHGGIDDATGRFVGAYMTKNECLHGYYEVMRQIVEREGIPASAYSDRHTIFVSPKEGKLTVQEQLDGKTVNDTQFGRAMKELGITLIVARSAQAKGRVERLWETLQSRLVIEFRIRGIKTVDEANEFLLEYMPKFNDRFAVEPELSEKAYRSNTLDLDLVLSVKESRVVDKGGVFSFDGKLWKITNDGLPANKFTVEVVVNATRGILAVYKGKVLDVVRYIKPKKAQPPKAEKKPPSKLGHHAHGNWMPSAPRYSFDLADKEIKKMLEDIFLSKYA